MLHTNEFSYRPIFYYLSLKKKTLMMSYCLQLNKDAKETYSKAWENLSC